MSNVIVKRQKKEKELIIENLKKMPIVQYACNRCGIGRATYYRWRKDDMDFTKSTDEAIFEGVNFINDLAESKLLSAINEGNLTAILYWLNHRHNAYRNKVEILTDPKQNQSLTPEQEAAVKKALSLTGLIEKEEQNGKKHS